ncbi:MAG: hypothetical protein RLZZ417_2297 [Bacteroidota bacterium]
MNKLFLASKINWIIHIIFWIVLFSILILLEQTNEDTFFTLSNELINLSFYMIIVYFNLGYLIPVYLDKKKILTYLFLLLLACFLLTPIKTLVLHLKLSDFPNYQYKLFEKQTGYFFVFVIISGFTTIGNIVVDWFAQITLRQQLENKNMQSELQFLKSQINPHFFFNTLNSLYSLTLKKSDLAPEIVIKLSDMMRYMLYECNEKKVNLSKEILYLQNYIDLEKLRQGNSIEILFEINGDTEDKFIAPLLLITFLENAFKHSVNTSPDIRRFVHINLNVDELDLHFYISNNKSLPAFNSENLTLVGGIGLENVNRRLQLIYPNRFELNILNLQQEYIVNLNLKLEE